jgi:SAM-dependent methyltransferase
MDPTQFDRFADEYHALHARNVAVTGESPEYFAEYKVRDISMQFHPPGRSYENLRILDFGSGVGSSIPFFRRYFPPCHLVCADVSQRSLAVANGRFGELASYVLFSGGSLPFKSGAFDIAFSAGVFHHIPTAEHVTLLPEIRRVLSSNSGRLFLYEHNPLNPLTRYAVNTCAFDIDAALIPPWRMHSQFRDAGYSNISVSDRVFFPRYLKFLRFLEFRLSSVPLGAQYCVTGVA